MTFKIVIVGGSVAGLALANMLEKFNIDYVVLEAYPEIAPQVGASIGLLPNGLRILDQLGCYEAYRAKAEDQVYQHAYLRREDGEIFSYQHDLMDMWEKMLGYPMIFIDRQMLIQVLYENLKHKDRVLTSQRVVSVDFTNSGAYVTTKDNKVFSGDIVVGADGIHSTVRKEMWRQAPTGYFPLDEESKVPASTLCVFGISHRPKAYPGASQHNTMSPGHSYFVMAAPGDRVYWFLFMELKTLYGRDIPRYTKADEEGIIKQHWNDQILENMTLGDLYEKRIATTLAPLQTYVFEKWHYKRAITIGDSAHKVDPVTGQGGNGAIESAAHLVNALLRNLDQTPNGLSEKQLESVFAEVQEKRFERAQHIVKQGYWLQDAFTLRTTMGKMIARYFMPLLGSFGVVYRGVEFCAPATKLERLQVPHRPRAVLFEDELPAKPLKGLSSLNKLFSVAFMCLLCAIAAGLLRLPCSLETLVGVLCSSSRGDASMLPAIEFMTNTAALIALALADLNRVGNQLTSVTFIVIFAIFNNTLGPGGFAPISCVFAHWSCNSIVGRHVPLENAKRVLPITAAGYLLPAAVALYRQDANSINVWRNAPILCFLLARSISVFGLQSGSQQPENEETKLQSTREKYQNMFAKADLPVLGLVYYSTLAISAAIHLTNVTLFGMKYSLFGGENAALMALGLSKLDILIFTLCSLLLALGTAPWSLRLCGYINTKQALTQAAAVILGSAVVGPAATLAGITAYREGIVASLSQ
ncbi:FAD binding domain-containing protein [Colletotrichum fioriniae PJ7]|uniref:FAD binding domain-containing protein n=1 Tax=Colletotrichum fioriniae PJ7 TaxID=1445577 RepID=A0A010Q8L3_9PEZI|nr:FAD binding domain-containing protein [Colletotrichum fioriniae PJ7]